MYIKYLPVSRQPIIPTTKLWITPVYHTYHVRAVIRAVVRRVDELRHHLEGHLGTAVELDAQFARARLDEGVGVADYG